MTLTEVLVAGTACSVTGAVTWLVGRRQGADNEFDRASMMRHSPPQRPTPRLREIADDVGYDLGNSAVGKLHGHPDGQWWCTDRCFGKPYIGE